MLIKNAKKQIPVTTFTTTVKVEATCKVKQVTYNNVIWVKFFKNFFTYIKLKNFDNIRVFIFNVFAVLLHT